MWPFLGVRPSGSNPHEREVGLSDKCHPRRLSRLRAITALPPPNHPANPVTSAPARPAPSTVWVLEAVYQRKAHDLATAIEMLLNHKDLTLQDSDAVAAALNLFRS